MPDATTQSDELSELVRKAQLGAISPADFERLGEITLRHCRIEAAKQVRAGVVPIYDLEVLATEAAARCFRNGLSKYDPSKAGWGTFCQRITANFAADEARERSRRQMLKIRLLNEQAVADNAPCLDLWSIAPNQKIRRNPDALYDWNQQIGKWMSDGIVPDYAEVKKLQKRIMQDYNL